MAKLIGLNKIKTAVFISGTGSNLNSLIKFSKIKNSPISIKLIDIGDFLSLENFMSDLRLLPVPEIKTAVFILLDPVNRAI